MESSPSHRLNLWQRVQLAWRILRHGRLRDLWPALPEDVRHGEGPVRLCLVPRGYNAQGGIIYGVNWRSDAPLDPSFGPHDEVVLVMGMHAWSAFRAWEEHKEVEAASEGVPIGVGISAPYTFQLGISGMGNTVRVEHWALKAKAEGTRFTAFVKAQAKAQAPLLQLPLEEHGLHIAVPDAEFCANLTENVDW